MRITTAMKSLRVRPVTATLVGICALATVAGGVAYAAIPDPGTGLFHGCVSTSTGLVRVIDPSKGQHCKATTAESAITWNATGPRGPAGPASNAYLAHNDSVVPLSGNVDTTVANLDLPAGNFALFAKVEVANNTSSAALVNCSLSSGDFDAVTVGATPEVFALQDLLTLNSAGHVTLKCGAADGGAARARITAVSVASRQG